MSFLPLSSLAPPYFYKHAGELERRQEDQDHLGDELDLGGRGGTHRGLARCLGGLLLRDRRAVRAHAPLTGRKFLIRLYKTADTDEKKAAIFRKGPHMWKPIEGGVRA